MSDNLDIASDREELDRSRAMTFKKPAGPSPTGRCLYCDEIVGDTQRWCDAECRDQWEGLRARRR
jgi:hypothetical protein